ncbi:MAG: DUF134 domain-containing protein [Bacteroidales bacterium]|nr:DUF134 domain-containing protein [Bacteroidales bacterium]
MPNRRRNRRIKMPPSMEGFKPFGIPMRELQSVDLLYEEFEALRLADYEDLTQEEAAQKMNISRPTFTRLYDKARKSIAKAFVEGKAIIIRGGTFVTDDYWYRCEECHETMVTEKPVKNCTNCDSGNIAQIAAKPDSGTQKKKIP